MTAASPYRELNRTGMQIAQSNIKLNSDDEDYHNTLDNVFQIPTIVEKAAVRRVRRKTPDNARA